MFHDIPEAMRDRMDELERLDASHRANEMDHFERLRQVPPITGHFIALAAAIAPEGRYIEIGTSGGYSALWVSLACRALGRKLTTFEIAESKVKLARETFRLAEVEDIVELVGGDARDYLERCQDVAFCFLDAEKNTYEACYEAVVPNMVKGGVFLADNVVSHEEVLGPFLKRALNDERVDAIVVPIGSGILLARRT